MKTYTATAVVRIKPGQGRVKLGKDQARRRAHNLEPEYKGRGGTFTPIAPIEFKAGEVFGFEGDLPKNMADCVTADAMPAAKPEPEQEEPEQEEPEQEEPEQEEPEQEEPEQE